MSRETTHAIPLSKIFLKKPRTHIVRGFFVKEYYIMFVAVQLFQLIYRTVGGVVETFNNNRLNKSSYSIQFWRCTRILANTKILVTIIKTNLKTFK